MARPKGSGYVVEQLNRIEGKLDELGRKVEELQKSVAEDARLAERTESGGEVKPLTGL